VWRADEGPAIVKSPVNLIDSVSEYVPVQLNVP